MTIVDWLDKTEADVWTLAEFDWAHTQGHVRLGVEVEPGLRTKFVADDGREFENLGMGFAEWVEQFKDGTMRSIFESSVMTAAQCRDFWQWLGRTDKAPEQLTIYIFAADMKTSEGG